MDGTQGTIGIELKIKVGIIARSVDEGKGVRAGTVEVTRGRHLEMAHQSLRRLVLRHGGMGKLDVGERIVDGEAPLDAETAVIGRPHPDGVGFLGI